ncbi:MAG TPA: GNAT family N-acetyltransferase [Anaeromyxobacter sp.]|nr:GNAT family N-acetyltransferase [Anaeromyxobacter sp.]
MPRAPEPLRVGRRVALRRVTRADRDAVLAMNRASRALHRPWVTPPVTRAEFDRWAARWTSPDYVSLAVCRRGDGEVVGIVNVSHIVLGPLRSAYLGYYASAALAGRGLMAEGLALAIRHCFDGLGLHRVEANIRRVLDLDARVPRPARPAAAVEHGYDFDHRLRRSRARAESGALAVERLTTSAQSSHSRSMST